MPFKIVTICGSMRYYQRMLTAAEILTERGYIVLMPFVSKVSTVAISAEELDKLHRAKIDMSESIFVVGEHKGQSTRDEMAYAINTGKGVFVANPSRDDRSSSPPCMGDCEYV